ncbi:helix-turn-helix domain-containing protein [Cryobacterium sp. PH31-AA6]|uniref:TetR/AcrR family transcriptional regulator n=1 Tax=Cryobacterium sp. PH31-AA6 TaxID=3046205 RepID=UPI0024BB5017|nr:helix-turn-helix domain-containing protein [Cryobacterium sp. PH31-AA6]MDJ0323714.1 helix-turn-helix domain-containing protein [Cryobacterium sp. PH31-AA6]
MDTVNPRRYDASRRREQARLTREAIVAAARKRFLADGFTATTLASIASDAGTSVDTIYKSFGGKAGLLRLMCEDALKGEGPVPAERRSDAMQAAEADPRTMLRGLGTLTTEVAPRIVPLLLLLSSAGETDDSMAQLRADFDASRLDRMTHVAHNLARRTQLRPGLSVDEAAEILWAYSSPELYSLFVLNRGWRPERYGEFVGESLVDALLGDAPRTPTPSRSTPDLSGPERTLPPGSTDTTLVSPSQNT